MSSTAVVVASVVLFAFLVVVLLVRSRSKPDKATSAPTEPPRAIEASSLPSAVARSSTAPAPAAAPPPSVETSTSSAPPSAAAPPSSAPADTARSASFPLRDAPLPSLAPAAGDESEEETQVEARSKGVETIPPSAAEVDADEILETTEIRGEAKPPHAPPPLPKRATLRSYSNITDESVKVETEAEREDTAPPPRPSPAEVAKRPSSRSKLTPSPKPVEEVAKRPSSRPKLTPSPKPVEAELAAKPTTSPAAETEAAESVEVPKTPAPSAQDRSVAKADAAPSAAVPAAKPAAAPSATGLAAKYTPPANPETAELEKNDARHAAARRFARLSVSEIKLYHEDEVKAGREANDLWQRLHKDITLARQTYESRVVAEVRGRFDYLYDEIVRQLAEGEPSKLGPGAPEPSGGARPSAPEPAPKDTAEAAPADLAATDPLVEPEAPTKNVGRILEPEATTHAAPAPTAAATAPPDAPSSASVKAAAGLARTSSASVKAAAPAIAPAEAPHASSASVKTAAPASDAKAIAAKVAARLTPSNPETAELEKSDPRHAAARRLARLSVSEIKLYHEDEVKAGREAKDLWKRFSADIALATQTLEKRIDKEVRDRFDYLYDEIVRQLAEGDPLKLGPGAPDVAKPAAGAVGATAADHARPAGLTPKAADSSPKAAGSSPKAAGSSPKAAGSSPKATGSSPKAADSSPKVAESASRIAPAAPTPASDAKLAAKTASPAGPKPDSARSVAAAKKPESVSSVAARYMPPSNPATAELEKADPRHAAARRLARLSVSEIKLYHEAEVTAGREARDLWRRLTADIALATQTFEKRVDQEVRDRFDYLYDEIVRQLAEGDAAKLGPDAPKPKSEA